MTSDASFWIVGPLFLIFFVSMWVVISLALVKFGGWGRYADRFAFDGPVPDSATRFRWQSLTIGKAMGGANYGNSVNMWIDTQAIYMRPSLPFRLFHAQLRLKRADMARVTTERIFVSNACKIVMKSDLPPLFFWGKAGKAIAENWSATGA